MTPEYHVVCHRNAYWVADRAGKPVSDRYDRPQAAYDRMQSLTRQAKRAGRTERPCICCGRAILSEGPHHRMCDYCRHRGSGMI